MECVMSDFLQALIECFMTLVDKSLRVTRGSGYLDWKMLTSTGPFVSIRWVCLKMGTPQTLMIIIFPYWSSWWDIFHQWWSSFSHIFPIELLMTWGIPLDSHPYVTAESATAALVDLGEALHSNDHVHQNTRTRGLNETRSRRERRSSALVETQLLALSEHVQVSLFLEGFFDKSQENIRHISHKTKTM